ncbi:zinc finger, LIM-type protein [Rhodotorula toruloides]|uniref:Zinc finger, LIM-type protein n=1 Tax=Rhodotorula toruloides TaxID=5286 RepID=A0A511K9S1_RHOTO|nr:zinc finger, LIM-type protein [Rhodotorula toruloides]
MAKGEDDDGGAQEMLDDFINGRKTDSIAFAGENGAYAASAALPERPAANKQCTLCARQISPSDIRQTSNMPLCRLCYVERYLPKCRKCAKPIEGGAVTSSDGKIVGKYHRDCFLCFECAAPFPDGDFYVYDGKPFCQLHYHTLNGSLCANAGCGKPIEGSCVSLVGEENGGGGRYHPPCFNCSTCHSPLLEHHFVVDRLPYCEAHAVRRRAQKAGTASEREERAKKRQTIITKR